MKNLCIAVLTLCVIGTSAFAKDFNVPSKNPVVKITVPNTWSIDESEYGYNAKTKDEAVYFGIEYASGSRIEKMLDSNAAWMKDNKIIPKGKPAESDVKIAGQDAHVLHFEATDPNGDTLVDFVLIPAGDKRLIMLTLWGSEEELKDNETDITKIQASIRPVN